MREQPKTKGAQAPERKPEMAYKKPQVVAKSAPKQSFVAGCGVNIPVHNHCHTQNSKCYCIDLK